MFVKNSTPSLVWQWSYILINVIAFLWMLSTKELMGDAQGLTLQRPEWLIMACVAVVAGYWFLLGPVFRLIGSLPVSKIRFGPQLGFVDDRLGIFLAVAQLAFMAFNIVFGVNVAGSGDARVDSSFSLLWVALPVDSLFLIYYAVARDSRFFRFNLVIYIVSNVMRGWLGIFLFVIFLEMCNAARSKKIRWRSLGLVAIVVLVCYPVMLNLKWLLRAATAPNFSLWDGLGNIVETLSTEDYLDIIGAGVMQIIGRLQITSSVEEVIRYSSQLQHAFSLGTFKPFWLEGIHGIVYDRLMYGENRPAIGVAFTAIGEFGGDFDVGSWNTNTGWVGWFFVAPLLVPFLIAYTLALCYLGFYFAKKLDMSAMLQDLVWFAWLVYILPGWLAAFVGFVYSLFVFLALKLTFSHFPRIALFRRCVPAETSCK
jgi:hypothetical protein